MALDMIMGLRIAQALISIITLSLNAAVLSWFNIHAFPIQNSNNTTWENPTPTSITFLTFTSVFTLLLALPYVTFAPKYFRTISSGWASLAVESLTCLFWLCGWISSAAYVGKLTVCRGSICGAARAGVVFGVAGWLVWCCSLWFPVRYCFFAKREYEIGDRRTGVGGLGGLRLLRLSGGMRETERERERHGDLWAGGKTSHGSGNGSGRGEMKEGKRDKWHRVWVGQKEKFGMKVGFGGRDRFGAGEHDKALEV